MTSCPLIGIDPQCGTKQTKKNFNDQIQSTRYLLFLYLIHHTCLYCPALGTCSVLPLSSHLINIISYQLPFETWFIQTPDCSFWLGLYYKSSTNPRSFSLLQRQIMRFEKAQGREKEWGLNWVGLRGFLWKRKPEKGKPNAPNTVNHLHLLFSSPCSPLSSPLATLRAKLYYELLCCLCLPFIFWEFYKCPHLI